MIMLHDAGYAIFYRVERDETSPGAPARLVKKAEQCFAELTVGMQRFYSAAAVSQRADRLIEIWRDDSISVRDVCWIGGVYYLIQQAARATDDDGLLVTRLTLEETDGSVWEGESNDDTAD